MVSGLHRIALVTRSQKWCFVAAPSQAQMMGLLSGESSARTIIVTAHPDDETVGLGARLRSLRHAAMVVATNGAPSKMGDAQGAGFTTRADYARAKNGAGTRIIVVRCRPHLSMPR